MSHDSCSSEDVGGAAHILLFFVTPTGSNTNQYQYQRFLIFCYTFANCHCHSVGNSTADDISRLSERSTAKFIHARIIWLQSLGEAVGAFHADNHASSLPPASDPDIG